MVDRECAAQYVCDVEEWLRENTRQSYYIVFEDAGDEYMWNQFDEQMPDKQTSRLRGCNIYVWSLCEVLSGRSNESLECEG